MTDAQTETHMNGRVKWFNKKAGYGFISVIDGSGADVFVHHTAVLTEVEQYRYLVEGEYVKFTIKSGDTNAVDVTGPSGGKLMCETRQMRRELFDAGDTTQRSKSRPSKQHHPKRSTEPTRKQVYVSGDIDDGCIWELVRRSPKSDVPPRKGPKIAVSDE